ncbi:cyclin-dependent protein kinase inhibitor SMR13-like [Bidens hawaiensis]|uniref:cyclin-dependent protein kinase inhibitor SMR13-like n=1 Tax=Bidens hawaiensis TaxID=980011 RepID=UPI004049A61E
MSTEHQFRQLDLPAINLSTLKLNLQPVSSDEECVTPTATEHRIPAILTCPPVPKRPRRVRKRKIHALPFVEFVDEDEIDSFFTSSYELINRNSSRKRSCFL